MSIDVAKIIAQNFAKFGGPVRANLPATLTKLTPGIRMPGAISGGTNPTSETFAAMGFVSGFTAFEITNTVIKDGDRKVILFGASIAGGAVPEPNDRVTIDGETLTIVRIIDRDPARATYSLQCRA
jgi:hypothetical protein